MISPVLPWCAVCRRRVERLTADEDFDTGAMVFVARCHGAEERVEIDRREIVEGARIEAGVAFAAPQIEARR